MRNSGRMGAGQRETDRIWIDLFTTPMHLDSAISKAPADLKPLLARVLPALLRQPHSLAQAIGMKLAPGEPWSLSNRELAYWEPARVLAEALMADDGELPHPVIEDFPPWMVQEWKKDWGEETAAHLASALALSPPLTLRASRDEDRTKLLSELSEGSELKGALTTRSATGIRFPGYIQLRGTRGREQGTFEIQDEGSQVMAHFALAPESMAALLSPRPQGPTEQHNPGLPPVSARKLIDVCAGAGGKTLALADLLGGRGRVYAYDVSEKKLQALRRRASRAGLRNIQTRAVEEGAELTGLDAFRSTADVVLVDAPCTGWGVLKRNPDIKWRQASDELERLPILQNRLLQTYSELVREGGLLVFGLCSFRKAESLDTVARFSAEDSRFSSIAGGFFGPDADSDGFYMHAWRRR